MSPGFGKRSQVTKNVGGERSPEPQSLYARRAHPTATLQPRRHAPLRPPPRSRRPGRDLASSPAAARTHLAAAHDPHRHRAPTLATHPTADPRHDDLAPTLHPKNSRSYARLRFLTGPYLRRAAFSHWARFLPCFLWQAFSAAASFCAFVLVLGQPVTEIGVF